MRETPHKLTTGLSTVHRICDGAARAAGGGVASEDAGPGGGADGLGSSVRGPRGVGGFL